MKSLASRCSPDFSAGTPDWRVSLPTSLGALVRAEIGLRGSRLDTDTGPMVREPWRHHAHQPSAVAAPVDLTDCLCHANTSTASRHTNGTRRPTIQSNLLRFIEIITDRGSVGFRRARGVAPSCAAPSSGFHDEREWATGLKPNGFALLRNGVRDARNDFHGAAALDITMAMAGYVSWLQLSPYKAHAELDNERELV